MKITQKLALATASINILIAGSLLIAQQAQAISFSFKKIVDENTPFPVPNDSGNFRYFGIPTIDNGYIEIAGTSSTTYPNQSSSPGGLFIYNDGALTTVADTLNPQITNKGLRNWRSVSSASVDEGNLVFITSTSGSERSELIYKSFKGINEIVADSNTPIPGRSQNFNYFSAISLENGNIVFSGGYSAFLDGYRDYNPGIPEPRGIYIIKQGNLIEPVVEIGMMIPGISREITVFSNPSFKENVVAFNIFSFNPFTSNLEESAVYTYNVNDKLFKRVANRDTQVPGKEENFTFRDLIPNGFFGEVAQSQENVLFSSGSGLVRDTPTSSGLYLSLNGALSLVADTDTILPKGTGKFTGFDTYSIDKKNLAFIGFDDNERLGLYAKIGDSLTKVIGAGDSLDGKFIRLLTLDREGLDEQSIVFRVDFTDNSRAIFRADAVESKSVPESDYSWGILGFGIFVINLRKLVKFFS
jgi:hypothetical protein